MGNLVPFDIVGSFNKSDYAGFNPEILVNWYVDTNGNAKYGKALYFTPGLNIETGIDCKKANATVRKTYVFQNKIYSVIGNEVFSHIYAFNKLQAIKLGEIETNSGYIGIADNGKQMVIVDGNKGWQFDTVTSTFSQISAGGFPENPIDVTVLGARFIVCALNSNKLHFSEINSATVWNALDEFAITDPPDNVVGVRRLNDRLFIMCNTITAVWYNAGAPVLPFRQSNILPYGCAAVGSIAEGFGNLMWLTKTDAGVGSIVMTSGTEAKSVGTKELETEFDRYTTVNDATAFLYRNERGHVFYQLNFTIENKTWLYDLTENRFSQLTYESKDRHLADNHVFLESTHYVGSYKESKIYELSTKYFDDDGVTTRRRRTSTIFYNKDRKSFVLNSAVFDLSQGVGLDGLKDTDSLFATDSNPLLRLRVSRDGGLNFGNELTSEVGQIGQTRWKTRFHRFGDMNSCVLDITYDQKTPIVVLGCVLDIDQSGGLF